MPQEIPPPPPAKTFPRALPPSLRLDDVWRAFAGKMHALTVLLSLDSRQQTDGEWVRIDVEFRSPSEMKFVSPPVHTPLEQAAREAAGVVGYPSWTTAVVKHLFVRPGTPVEFDHRIIVSIRDAVELLPDMVSDTPDARAHAAIEAPAPGVALNPQHWLIVYQRST